MEASKGIWGLTECSHTDLGSPAEDDLSSHIEKHGVRRL